jgi:uncharacterized protein YajQ (UPF0234 family)
MAQQNSFDVSTGADLQEVDNAVNQAMKEVATRYDFKGSNAEIRFDRAEAKLTLDAPDEYKLKALYDVLQTKLIRRNVPVRNLDPQEPQPASGGRVRQEVSLKQGIPTDTAREIGPSTSVQVNTLGSDILGSGQTAADGKLLHVLRDVVDHLNADDVASLAGTDLQRLMSNLDGLNAARATTGATQNRIDLAGERLADLRMLAVEGLGEIESVDYAEAILALNSQTSAYQAALKTASTVIQPSLLDFLR